MNSDKPSTHTDERPAVSLAAMVPFFEASLDGIVVVDSERRYLYVNPAAEEIFAERAEELIGKDFLVTFPERMHPVMLGYFGSTLDGKPGLWETTIARPDGAERDVQFSNLEIELDGRNVVAAIIRDLTDARWRIRESEAAARVAATFTLDRPMDDALDRLCQIVIDSGAAVACSASLPVPRGPLTTIGAAGHPPGYREAMAKAWEAGPPEFTLPYLRSLDPALIENARTRLAQEPAYAVARDVLAQSQWEHMLVVPLVYRGRARGGLTVCYREHELPSAREVRLLMAIASQAAVAVENSRLLGEARERSTQLSALLNASALVTANLDPDVVIQSVLEQVPLIVDYSGSSVMLIDSNDLVIVAARFAPGVRGYTGQPRFPLKTDTGLFSAFYRGEVVRVADIDGETQYARELRQALGDRRHDGFGHIRSWMAIPLRAQGRLIGILTVSKDQPAYFTDQHEQLLAGLANHAAHGIERARLFQEAEKAAAETAALVRVASAMTFDQPADRMLNVLAETVVSVTGAAACAVIFIDDTGQHAELVGTHNLAPGYVEALEAVWRAGASSPTLAAYREREVQVVPHVTDVTLADAAFAPIHDLVRDTSWNTLVAVPLVYRSEAIGSMNVYYASAHLPADADMAYLRALADQAAVAGANIRLFAEGERRRRRAEALARGASAMTFHETPKAVLDLLAENVLAVTSAVSAGIIVTDRSGSHIAVVGAANLPPGYMETIEQLWHRGTRIAGFEAARTGQLVVAHDLPSLSTDVDLLAPYRDFTQRYWETLVAIPLTYRGEPLGTLNVCFSKDCSPDDDDMAVLRALADQAAVTAANLNLFTETEQRRNRAETLARVAQALAGRRSIEDTLDALTQVVVESTGAVASSVTLIDDEEGAFTLAGSYGLPESFTRVIREAWAAGRTTMMTRAIETQQPRVTRRGKQRFLEDPDYAGGWDAVRKEPWEPVALVPMVYRDRTVGLLGSFYLPEEAPSDDDISVLAAIADQAAVAVENRRLFVETERRLRQLEAVARIASNLTFDQPLEQMMLTLAQSVVQATGAIACSVTRVDESTTVPMRVMAMSGLPDGYREALQSAYDADAPSVIMTAYHDREAMIVHNSRSVTLEDPRYAAAAALVTDAPWDCVGVIPIIYRQEALGLLTGYYPARTEPSNEEMAYLTAIADQAAIAIKNASLVEQAQQSAAVGERQRLARELHDSVSQALYGIALGARTARTLLDRDPVKAVEPVDYVLQLAQAGLAEMRALIFELRPESLAQEGIVAALEKHVAAANVRYGLKVEADLGPEPLVPLDVKEAAYRIGQEALHNIIKHAKATHVWLRLRFAGGLVSLDIKDDGVGFDPHGDYPGHLGLKSMRERAARVRGALEFTSEKGKGTAINLRIPVPEGAEPHMPAALQT